MQKAKAEAEEAARRKSETSDQPSESQPSASKEELERSPTPKQEPVKAEANAKSEENKKHHKTKSESAREATFASLQRALNAAAAARDRFTRRGSRTKHESPLKEEPISPTSMAPPKANPSAHENKGHASLNQSYQDWSGAKESTQWTSSQGQSDARPFPSTSQAFSELPRSSHSMQHNVDAFAGTQFPQHEDWVEAPKDQHAMHGVGADASIGYTNMQYPLSMQTPDIAVTRRESSSALTASLEGIGICTSGSSRLPQSSNQGESTWKEPGKELDLAARRKRPRPAAIGTSNTRSLANSTSMSSLAHWTDA